MEFDAGKKMNANNLSKEAVVALSLCTEWPHVSPHAEGAGLVAGEQERAIARHDGVASGQGGAGGRQVGSDEE